jgi:hypothetical protein
MSWQDMVMTCGQFIFAVSLIPTIRAKEKPAWSTSLMTSIVSTAYIPTLWSLGLYVSFVATILVTLGWWTLFFQSCLAKRKVEKI